MTFGGSRMSSRHCRRHKVQQYFMATRNSNFSYATYKNEASKNIFFFAKILDYIRVKFILNILIYTRSLSYIA